MFEGGTNAYNNWIDLSVGGFIPSGNKAQAQQRHQNSRGAFGGIEDFHYQTNFDKTPPCPWMDGPFSTTTTTSSGWRWTREKIGYLRFSYSEFRTWYNGDGGFYPPSQPVVSAVR